MRSITDHAGNTWTAQKTGRTSGIANKSLDGSPSALEPADVIRFACSNDPHQRNRETILKAGLFESLSDADLASELASANEM